MTASTYARHKVTDFDTWKQSYDASGPIRAEGGVIADSVHRDVYDPNLVVVRHQFADSATALAFIAMMQNPAVNQPLRDMGVDVDSLEVWVCEDV